MPVLLGAALMAFSYTVFARNKFKAQEAWALGDQQSHNQLNLSLVELAHRRRNKPTQPTMGPPPPVTGAAYIKDVQRGVFRDLIQQNEEVHKQFLQGQQHTPQPLFQHMHYQG